MPIFVWVLCVFVLAGRGQFFWSFKMKQFAILFAAVCAMCLMSSESQAQYSRGGYGYGGGRGGFSLSIGSGYGGGYRGGYGGGYHSVARPVYGGYGGYSGGYGRSCRGW